MGRRLRGRRGHSKLPQLVDLFLSRPLISSAMIEKELKVTTRGALNLIAELGLREITGRGRYRAWGVVLHRLCGGSTDLTWRQASSPHALTGPAVKLILYDISYFG